MGKRLIAALVVLIVVVVLAVTLAGCHVGLPCSDHGGVKWTNSKWTNSKIYECNDGTWE